MSYISENNAQQEYFTGNIDELLDMLLDECVKKLEKNIDEMSKDDKVAAVKFLDEKGVFLVKKSTDKVASFFNISKFTLYNYLDEIRQTK